MKQSNTILEAKKHIIIVGDIMLDKYIVGQNERTSPEADVPLVEYQETDYRLGGAANVALNLHTLGLTPHLISIIGEDKNGEILNNLCQEALPKSSLMAIPERPTTTKTRVVNTDYKQLIRVDKETTQSIPPKVEGQIKQVIDMVLNDNQVSGIVIQDYNKGLCTAGLIQYLQVISKNYNIPLFVDPKKDNFKLLSKCTVFKPNLKELSIQLKRAVPAEMASIRQAIIDVGLEQAEYIFVTLAERGVYYRGWDKSINPEPSGKANGASKSIVEGVVPGLAIKGADVSGAGDSVLAMLIKAYLDNYAIDQMARLANQVGALACKKKGVSSIKASEIDFS